MSDPASPSRSTGRSVMRRALRARPGDLVLACVLYSMHQLGEALVPVLVGVAIGQAVALGSPDALVLWLGLLAVDFAFLSLSYRFGARASTRAKQHSAHALRMTLVERILDPRGGADLAPGQLLARATSDADRVGAAVGALASSVAAAIAVIVASAFLFAAAPALGAVILVGTLVVLVATSAVSRAVARRSMAEQHAAADATLAAADIIHGLRTLAGLGAGRSAAHRYRATSGAATSAAVAAVDSASVVSGVATVLSGLYLAIVAAVAGWLALQGRLDVGGLISALGLAVFLAGPLQSLTSVPAVIARARASAERVAEVLSLGRAVADTGHDTSVIATGDIVVRVDGLTFTARAERMTGVTVEDPATQARLASLFAREHDDPHATASIGGIEIDTLPLHALRETIVVSPHDAALFDETLRASVGGSDQGALAAARAAYVDEIIASAPDGWDTATGESGGRLSGGQRQRVALARALAAEASVLVLHDPTTAVDAVTEGIIADRTATLRRGRTTIILTGSPALLARCDSVVVLAASQVRTGRHEDLWRTDAAYRRLVTR